MGVSVENRNNDGPSGRCLELSTSSPERIDFRSVVSDTLEHTRPKPST